MIDIPDRNTTPTASELPAPDAFDGRVAPYAIGSSDNPGTPYIPWPTNQADPKLNWWNTAASVDGMDFSNERQDVVNRAQQQFLLDTMKPGGLVVERGSSGTSSPWKKAHDAQFDVDYVSDKMRDRSYSGIDIVPTIAIPNCPPVTIGDIQTISVSTHREKFAVRVCGRSNPIGYTNGPRTVAGSMIFSLIDVYPWYKMMNDAGDAFWEQAAEFPLADSLPPFDITITFHNEYEPNKGAVMRLYGVQIVDDGQVMSIDDLVTENTYSYVALGIAPVHRSTKWEVKK